jgi:hypothetical protein
MERLAGYVDEVLHALDDHVLQNRVRSEILENCQTFPIYRNVLARHERMLAV